jgi:superfamily II helicase
MSVEVQNQTASNHGKVASKVAGKRTTEEKKKMQQLRALIKQYNREDILDNRLGLTDEMYKLGFFSFCTECWYGGKIRPLTWCKPKYYQAGYHCATCIKNEEEYDDD